MAKRFVLRELECDPSRFVRIGMGLLGGEPTEPEIVVAWLRGDAILLGRHQRAASALRADPGTTVLRRVGGGRTILAGEGALGVYVRTSGEDVPPDKVLNRLVRGVAAAVGGHYFGRDWISRQRRQLGVVAHEATSRGVVLLEAILGIRRTLELPASQRAYPAHSDQRAGGPEWGSAGDVDVSAIAHGAPVARAADPPREGDPPDPPVVEDDTGWRWSGLAQVPIGFVEAQVRCEGEKILAARLRGDFLAPAEQVRALERSAAGVGEDPGELAAAFSRALRETSAWGAILGVDDPSILASAIHAAVVS